MREANVASLHGLQKTWKCQGSGVHHFTSIGMLDDGGECNKEAEESAWAGDGWSFLVVLRFSLSVSLQRHIVLHLRSIACNNTEEPCQLSRFSRALSQQPSLFAYWLWSCVVTVLILLTKYWHPRDVTLLNYFLQPRGITSACWTCSTDGRSISLAATIRPPLLPPTPSTTSIIRWLMGRGTFLLHDMYRVSTLNARSCVCSFYFYE